MSAAVTITLLGMLLFAALFMRCRSNVLDLRERLEEAYEARDDAMVNEQAAEAKAAQLAAVVSAMAGTADLPAADAFLLSLEAEMDGEAHGLAAILSANDLGEDVGESSS